MPMDSVGFDGRILFLASDPGRIDAQLAGADLTLVGAGLLRDDVSTDEITPIPVLTYFDERLGRYPYVGFETGGRRPIGTDGVRNGGFVVTVAFEALRERLAVRRSLTGQR